MQNSETVGADSFIVLKEHEVQLLETIESYLDTAYPEERRLVKEKFKCLYALGDAISLYPPIRTSQSLKGIQRDEDTLIKALSNFTSTSHLFHLPTRIVAMRTFLVAKFHSFSMISIILRDTDKSKAFYIPLRSVLLSIICILMAEDVYLACLDDTSFPHEGKIALADELLSLWDYGRDPRALSHLPDLEALWTNRDKAPPSFGTMQGSSELIRISIDMDENWRNFLVAETEHDETKWALEEFLFGLSFEQIRNVRTWISQFGVIAVGYDEIRSYVGAPAYGAVKNTDPRTIYDFYVERRDAAVFRQRLGTPGPQKTLEELYLRYLITHQA